MFCKNCGHNMADGARFCTECGTLVTDEARDIYDKSVQERDTYQASDNPKNPEPVNQEDEADNKEENTQNVCSVCNAPNAEGLKFCVNCGASLYEAEANNEQTENTQVTNYDVEMKPKKKKSKALLIIIIIAAVLLVGFILLVGAVAAFLIFDPFNLGIDLGFDTDFGFGKEKSEPAFVETVEDYENNGQINTEFVYDITSPIEEITEPEESAPITDNTGYLSKSQMQTLLSKIETKEFMTGLKIKIVIKDDLNEDAEHFANEECYNECDDNGIYVVIDTNNYKAAIATTGDGEKYVGAAAKKLVKDQARNAIMDRKYYDVCVDIIDSILDSEKSSQFEAVENAQQVIYVEKNSGSNTGKLTLVEWVDGDELVLFEINKVYLGKDGITSSPSETKSATPKGTFKLGFAFSDKKLNTKLDSRVIKSGDVWVDDPDSKYYNTLQHGSTSNSKWDSAENTYYAFSSGVFEACILIEHNGDGYTKGVSGKGSCIYISGKNKELSTSYGDVNISGSQMEELLSLLDESQNPHIVIR